MAQPSPAAAIYADGLNAKFAEDNTACHREFVAHPGRTWDKLMVHENGRPTHIHAFVCRETGGVYKAEGVNKPARHERYADVLSAVAAADLYGSYLYLR